MTITSDWRLHSRNSCDEASLVLRELVTEAAAAGITDFGVTDHINTPCNLPDLAASREEFLACSPPPRFHFGVEVSCVSAWELAEMAKGAHGRPVYGLRSGGPGGCRVSPRHQRRRPARLRDRVRRLRDPGAAARVGGNPDRRPLVPTTQRQAI